VGYAFGVQQLYAVDRAVGMTLLSALCFAALGAGVLFARQEHGPVALVTGGAGFIGSHLSERLVAEGHEVIAIDNFLDFYSRGLKEANLTELRSARNFRLIEGDLNELDLSELVRDRDWIFHQAAQAGVRSSWGKSFDVYTSSNIAASQKLLEASVHAPRLQRFIFASSSSVYGNAPRLPVTEETPANPISPYGVTKLAAEHLCVLYAQSFGLPTVSLRYFTVYGPRQRPDMGFHKFLRATILDESIDVYGDGEQTRDFTYVHDAVNANVLAAARGVPGRVYNIGGGSRVSVNDVLAMIERVSGRRPRVTSHPAQKGDMRHTYADTSLARAELGFVPTVGLQDGLAAEYRWLTEIL
jgi:UDP-glucose 4-epimerase